MPTPPPSLSLLGDSDALAFCLETSSDPSTNWVFAERNTREAGGEFPSIDTALYSLVSALQALKMFQPVGDGPFFVGCWGLKAGLV